MRELPDDARVDPGRARRDVLALPRPGAPDRAAAVVPARSARYLEENDRRLQELAASGLWDEVALASQQIVLGRVDGVEVELARTTAARS